MKNIYSNIFSSNLINIKKAKKNLINNKIIAVPTETVYGLAGNAYSNQAVKKIYKLKNRPFYNPSIIHFYDLTELKKNVVMNKDFIKLYKIFCPGPITFILNKKKNSKVSKLATANNKTLAVRIPKHKILRKLLNIINFPLAAPSANKFSQLSPTSAKDVIDEFGGKINFVLNGGRCISGIESTVLDLTKKPKILRPGIITKKDIEKVIKKKVSLSNRVKNIKSPGQLKFHYSPGIPVRLNAKYPKKNEAFIIFSNSKILKKNYFPLTKKGSMKDAAKNLFKTLRKIKKIGYSSIAVSKIPNEGLGVAINDRLKKASKK